MRYKQAPKGRKRSCDTFSKGLLVTGTIVWWVYAVLFLIALTIKLQAAEKKSNVIIITIDTVRADHLGCYGYGLVQTPNIDALARSSARFRHAFTTVPLTLPAHASLFTGSFPMATGVHDFASNTLPSTAVTLATVLRENGYATAAFLGSPVLDARYGLNQGFDTYFDHFDLRHVDEDKADVVKRPGDKVMDEALGWLKRGPRQPFFLWVHLYDAHYPYQPPEPFATRYKTRPYDGEIAFVDAQVGRLVSFLKEKESFANSLVVLASDHGESLGNHGEQKHGFFIYDSTLRVPLMVKVPGATPRVVGEDASLVDVMPTVLQALHIPIPPTVQGSSLLSRIMGRPGPGSSNVYAETFLPLLHFSWSQLRALRWKGLKYIEAPRPELYDAIADPHETKNLLATRPAVAQVMRDRLAEILRRYTSASGEQAGGKEFTDPALLDRLHALGYVTTPAGTVSDAIGKQLPDPKDRLQVYELFWEAMADRQQGRYEESLRKLGVAQKFEPDSLPVLLLETLDYFQLRNFPQAIQLFNSPARIQFDSRGTLIPANRDDDTAGHNQHAASQNRQGGRLPEPHSGEDLGQKEKDNYIDAKQFPEVPTRYIDHQSISDEGGGPGQESNGTADSPRTIESGLKAGVPISFQKSRQHEYEESATAMSNDVIQEISHTVGDVPDIVSAEMKSL